MVHDTRRNPLGRSLTSFLESASVDRDSSEESRGAPDFPLYNVQRHSRREFFAKAGLVAAITGLLGIGGGYLIYRDKKQERQAYNSVARAAQYQEVDVYRGDSYWRYAAQLRRENPHLKTLNAEEIAEALQELNEGKPLIAGKKVKIPDF